MIYLQRPKSVPRSSMALKWFYFPVLVLNIKKFFKNYCQLMLIKALFTYFELFGLFRVFFLSGLTVERLLRPPRKSPHSRTSCSKVICMLEWRHQIPVMYGRMTSLAPPPPANQLDRQELPRSSSHAAFRAAITFRTHCTSMASTETKNLWRAPVPYWEEPNGNNKKR